jgi:hypothetical protein
MLWDKKPALAGFFVAEPWGFWAVVTVVTFVSYELKSPLRRGGGLVLLFMRFAMGLCLSCLLSLLSFLA